MNCGVHWRGSSTRPFSICCLCTTTGSKQVCEYALQEKSCFISFLVSPTGFQPSQKSSSFLCQPPGLVIPIGSSNSTFLKDDHRANIYPSSSGSVARVWVLIRLLFLSSFQELCSSFFMVLVIEALF